MALRRTRRWLGLHGKKSSPFLKMEALALIVFYIQILLCLPSGGGDFGLSLMLFGVQLSNPSMDKTVVSNPIFLLLHRASGNKLALFIRISNIDLPSLFIKKVEDDASTRFWDDIWAGSKPLKEEYYRIYRLETEPEATVQILVLGSWAWSRAPRAGPELSQLMDLEELMTHLIPLIDGLGLLG